MFLDIHGTRKMIRPIFKLVYYISILAVVNGVCNLGQDLITLADWTGSLHSPGYTTGSYPVNQDCTWNIRVSKGSRVKLTFTLFQLQRGARVGAITTCYDRLQIIDNNEVILEACGGNLDPKTFTTSSNEVTITFHSDEQSSSAGFRLEYVGICSGDITANTIIETPNFPGSVPNSRCDWNIILPDKTAAIIQLNNQDNDLPSCNISPLTVTEKNPPNKQRKLCLVESKALTFKDVTFTYEVTDSSVPWNGSLKIEFKKNPQCTDFCVHGTECKTPRRVRVPGGYKCICNEGFTGRNCDVRIEILDPCYPKSCQNGGACVRVMGEFTCSCPANYTGETCETLMDPCYPDSCLNGGTCDDVAEPPACRCPVRFTGKRCEVKIDPCIPLPCKHKGICVPSEVDYTCACPPNTGGKSCEVILDPCFPNTCINDGVCRDDTDKPPFCSCPVGFAGKRCEDEIDPCASVPCKNNGTCIRGVNGYSCNCPPNFTGNICELDRDPCYPDTCLSGGKCIVDADYPSFCSCPPAFTGKRCEKELDPCFPESCTNGGICEVASGTPSCSCSAGFTGKRCEIKIDLCVDLPCKNNGECVANDGVFTCFCAPSYTGRTCEQVLDLCYADSCLHGGTCKVTNGTPTCTCASGFTGKRCGVQHPCSSIPCKNNGECVPNGNSFMCNCSPNHTGLTCEDVLDPCYPDSCHNGGICEDANGKPTCACPEGYTGKQCELLFDPCAQRPCKNDATCLSGVGSYSCICSPQFTGKTCDAILDPCFPETCLNGGTCEIAESTCSCPQGYTGSRCEVKTDPCDTQPCENGGSCFSEGSQFRCECVLGFAGITCSVEDTLCVSNPCQNNATCNRKPAGYTCKCITGFSGIHCEINTDNCAFNMCQNGGTCVDGIGTFSCLCPEGYIGYLCDSDVDACASASCKHGQCIDEQRSYYCECDEDYRGRYCDIHKDQGYCKEGRDSVVSSRILWFDTLVNVINIRPCPPDIIGNASRSCVEDPSSETGGTWTRPDLSECVSPEFMDLAMAASLAKVEGFTGDNLMDVTTTLVAITNNVKRPNKYTYPGDLRMAGTVISLVADGLQKAETTEETAINVAQGVTKAIDNTIDPSTMPTWENARANVVVEGIKELLASTETMAEYFETSGLMYRTKRSANRTEEPHEFRFSGRNVEISISTIKNNSSIVSALGTAASSSIVLPQDILNKARVYTDSVSFYNARFSSLAKLVSMKEKRYGGDVSESRVTSDIVSSKVLGFPAETFNNLQEPVIITFKIKHAEDKPTHLTEYCVFMNMSAQSSDDQWSTEGCVLFDSNSTHVTCHCYHLTNFALLLDVYGTIEQLDETNNAILSYISYIGGSLSILGCLASIIVFEYFRLKSERIRIHEMLAVSIIMVQVIFLVGIGRTSDKTTTPTWACKTVAVLLHYAVTALFCWMLVEGIHLYVALVRVFKRGSHLKKYMALGWGVPLVIVMISVGAFYDKYGDGTICWIDGDLLLMCFVPTVGIVVTINTVILVIIIRVMMRSLNSTAKVNVQEISNLKISVKAAVVLLPLLGLTWTLAFLAVNERGTEVLGYVFTYLFTIGNAFQGLIFFVFHCLMNVDVHSAFKRRYRKQKTYDTSSSRARKTSEMDSYAVEGKGTLTPKFIGVIEKTNNTNANKAHFNPNIHFKDYDDEDDKMWKQYTIGQGTQDDPFVLRLRPSSDSDPVVSEYISDIEDYLDKPSRHSVQFCSNT